MLNNRRPSDPSQQPQSPALKRVRKSVYRQALLAGFVLILTVVILFAVTAAWYTNIIQSNDLVFKASKWSFNGTVKSADVTVVASPGDEGVVELTAVSDSDDITAVSVNISRAQMPVEMQKRIYFYVDTPKTQNGETMDRIYLGNNNSYTYLLFGKDTLTLTEAEHNDALLKWHWVYDVLGYYVLGTWDGTDMTVTEYLRPIEYSYTQESTTFDANGNLATTDGSYTAEQLLVDLSLKDGYPGQINTSIFVTTSDKKTYYPVAVDAATGQSVWAYLCTYSEIQVNTVFDTDLGENVTTEDQPTIKAKLTLAAQNSNLEPEPVANSAALKAALTSGESVVRLSSNITLDETLTVGTAGQPRQIMLDLNGNTLSVDSGSSAAIQVAAGSGLTVTNGTLAGSASGYAIEGAGAEITLSKVNITGVKRALVVRDNSDSNTTNSDAKIRLVDCDIETTDVAILISGNGSDSAQATRLVVEDCSIRSDYIGIAFNGSTDQWGTATQIINSQVYGKWAGVYHPQSDAELMISGGSTISGYTGLVLKGGSTTVVDSKVYGTGAGIGSEEPTVSLSGFCDTGDGIYIEANYDCKIALSVSGNSVVTSENNLALRVYPESDKVSVLVSGGVFSSKIADKYLAGNTTCTGSDNSYVVSAVAVDAGTE